MTRNPPPVNIKSKVTYRYLLGEDSWQRLHPAIQKRFSEQYYQQPVTYTGTMQEVYLSTAGKILAQACRLIGTPLALYNGRDIPTDVYVYHDSRLQGMTWDRHYHYPNKPTNRVKSTKCLNADTGLIELAGFGFGMQLKLYEQEGALHFESTRFFYQFGKLKVTIPDWLTPGKTIAVQQAIDDSRFQFLLDVRHALLGQVFRQVGEFKSAASKGEAQHLARSHLKHSLHQYSQ